ncbi:MAG: TonB-dependent receptor [Calditrichia bacterium]
MTYLKAVALTCTLFFLVSLVQGGAENGRIVGQVTDAVTREPLVGANIVLLNTGRGAAASGSGWFEIPAVAHGSYQLNFYFLGYETAIIPDVIVRPGRVTRQDVALKPSSLESEEVVVSGSYFQRDEMQPLSRTRFSREEIRRAPGSAGDISRILQALPSLAKVNDQSNNLIVRGGSPLESGFYLDNIEIPNINHFPSQGASGGPIGLLNVDLIEQVNFQAGGFAARFGDRLSSIMEIVLREGNRDEFDGQLDLNFAGFGGVVEGPVWGDHGSYVFSLRRSYLDFLVNLADLGTTVAPRYGDFTGKAVFDISPANQLTLLSVWADDHNNPDRETAVENDMVYYGNQDILQQTSGINLRSLWKGKGFSNTSLAWTKRRFRETFLETGSDVFLAVNRSAEQQFKIRNVNNFRLSGQISIETGVEAALLISDYENYYGEITGVYGDTISALKLDRRLQTQKIGIFGSIVFQLLPGITVTPGLRLDYFSYGQNWTSALRLAFSWKILRRTFLNLSGGVYYQHLPLLLLAQYPENKDLKPLRSLHLIAGIEQILSEDSRLTMELYEKRYSDMPLDPQQPGFFVLDEFYYRYGFFFSHGPLQDVGRADSRGIEIMLQKKLAEQFYGLASTTWFRSRYRDLKKDWHNRVYDNRLILSLEGGFKPGNKYEFSIRAIYAGGTPYTPLNLAETRRLNREVLDEYRINDERYPEYYSLNLRADRRFTFHNSNLIFYLSVWNVTNRKNVAAFFWNKATQKVDTIYQWGILPVFGLEYEF